MASRRIDVDQPGLFARQVAVALAEEMAWASARHPFCYGGDRQGLPEPTRPLPFPLQSRQHFLSPETLPVLPRLVAPCRSLSWVRMVTEFQIQMRRIAQHPEVRWPVAPDCKRISSQDTSRHPGKDPRKEGVPEYSTAKRTQQGIENTENQKRIVGRTRGLSLPSRSTGHRMAEISPA